MDRARDIEIFGEERVPQRKAEISVSAKLRLFEHYDKNPSSTRQELASWLLKEELVTKAPDKTTISKILKKRSAVEALAVAQSATQNDRKRQRSGNVPELNAQLKVWFNDWERKNAPCTDATLIEKAKQIGANLNLPASFTYSNDWLRLFKAHNSIKQQMTVGESGSSNEASVLITRNTVPKLVEIFGLSNMFNADETGLFWRRLPHRTLASIKRKGKKLSKDRFTILVTVCADGTKMVLLLVGIAKRPRSFPRNFDPYTSWGMPYYFNKTAWMTSEIWAQYLKHFKSFVNGRAGVTQNTRVCLLVDNVP